MLRVVWPVQLLFCSHNTCGAFFWKTLDWWLRKERIAKISVIFCCTQLPSSSSFPHPFHSCPCFPLPLVFLIFLHYLLFLLFSPHFLNIIMFIMCACFDRLILLFYDLPLFVLLHFSHSFIIINLLFLHIIFLFTFPFCFFPIIIHFFAPKYIQNYIYLLL